MFPPVFERVKNVAGVQDAFGTDPVRVFPFGQAPSDTTKPYCVWQTVYGSPQNYLDKVPDGDGWGVQFDVYAPTGAAVRAGAQALRDALQTDAYLVRYGSEGREPDTKLYRYSFDVEFLEPRA